MSKGLFITGTGTDIGKTYVTALLIKVLRQAGLNAGYYKAALSGNECIHGKLIPGDCKHVVEISGMKEDPMKLVSYVYETGVSPHLAAKIEGQEVDFSKLITDFYQSAQTFDYLIMEGSGGIVCPIRTGEQSILLEDIIKRFHLDLLIVADAGLGTLNNVVLTYEYAKQRHMCVKGIIINRYDETNYLHQDNRSMMEALTGLPVITCIGEKDTNCHISVDDLCNLFGDIDTNMLLNRKENL